VLAIAPGAEPATDLLAAIEHSFDPSRSVVESAQAMNEIAHSNKCIYDKWHGLRPREAEEEPAQARDRLG
jgi:hypothetical protein